jgi:AraC family transcriptional regulator
VPARARVKLVNDDDPRGLAVALYWATLRETARNALGTAGCEIACWFKAWNPFLREAGDTLSALHASSSPDPASLAAFADVFALHLVHRYGNTADSRDAGTSPTQSKLSVVEHFIHEHIAQSIPDRGSRRAPAHESVAFRAGFQERDGASAALLSDDRKVEMGAVAALGSGVSR